MMDVVFEIRDATKVNSKVYPLLEELSGDLGDTLREMCLSEFIGSTWSLQLESSGRVVITPTMPGVLGCGEIDCDVLCDLADLINSSPTGYTPGRFTVTVVEMDGDRLDVLVDDFLDF